MSKLQRTKRRERRKEREGTKGRLEERDNANLVGRRKRMKIKEREIYEGRKKG